MNCNQKKVVDKVKQQSRTSWNNNNIILRGIEMPEFKSSWCQGMSRIERNLPAAVGFSLFYFLFSLENNTWNAIIG